MSPQPDTPDAIRQAHAASIDTIRKAARLSDQAKRVEMARFHVAAKAAMTELQQRSAAERVSTRQNLMRTAFGYGHEKNLYANDEHRTAAQALHRDAVARVDNVDDPRKLSQLLQQAHELGDESLARAVGYRAFKLGSTGRDVLVDYANADTRKSQGRAVADLFDLPADPTPLEDFMQHVVPKPPELDKMTDTGIHSLAQTNLGD